MACLQLVDGEAQRIATGVYLGVNAGLVGKGAETSDGIIKGDVDFDAFGDEVLEVLEL